MDMETAAREDVDKNDAEATSAGAPTFKKTKKRKRKRPADNDPWSVVRPPHHILGSPTRKTKSPRSRTRRRRHRSLIRSPPQMSSFYSRLDKPVPRPHVAYVAAAQIKRRPEHEHPTSGFHGFRFAGEGLHGIGDTPAPMSSLAGYRFLGTEYVNTCNGVLLLASKGFSDPCRCTLWNPAMGMEVTVPKPPLPEKKTSVQVVLSDDEDEDEDSSIQTVLLHDKTQFLALGLGCGKRSHTYKLLLCRKVTSRISRTRPPSAPGKQASRLSGGTTHHFEYSLVVHSLTRHGGGGGGASDDMPVPTVLPMETVLSYKDKVDREIMEGKSVYVDGTIYFHYWKKNAMLAFDVDDETVRTIDLPSKHQKDDDDLRYEMYGNVLLIEMYGRPCLAITTEDRIAIWLLTEDYQLEPVHVISYHKSDLHYWRRSIVGVWDCGGVLVLCLECLEKGELLLYDVAAKKIFRANLPGDFAMKKSEEYMICWGYERTLEQPKSIVGGRWQQGPWEHITEVVKPLVKQDVRKGQKATLSTVCLMEFLARIMQKLPHDLQYVVGMPAMDSEEPDLLFKNVSDA